MKTVAIAFAFVLVVSLGILCLTESDTGEPKRRYEGLVVAVQPHDGYPGLATITLENGGIRECVLLDTIHPPHDILPRIGDYFCLPE